MMARGAPTALASAPWSFFRIASRGRDVRRARAPAGGVTVGGAGCAGASAGRGRHAVASEATASRRTT